MEAADEPIDFDDADAVVAAVEEEMGSRPAMTPRVVTAVVDLPAADAAATDEDEDAAAVRAAPLAKAADSFEVLLLLGESSVSASLSSSSWGLVTSEWSELHRIFLHVPPKNTQHTKMPVNTPHTMTSVKSNISAPNHNTSTPFHMNVNLFRIIVSPESQPHRHIDASFMFP